MARVVQVPGAPMDAFLFLSAANYLAGHEPSALQVFDALNTASRQGRQMPVVSTAYFERLGKLIDALGERRGDDLHRFMQRHRFIPWQDVGRLGAEDNWLAVEPWNFSREATQFFPKAQAEFADLQKLIEAHVLPGWLPQAPPFTRGSALLTMGSCFAQNLRNYLAERGLQSGWMFVPPGLNNTFALRNFIDWCLTGERSSDAYWYDAHAKGGAVRWEPPAEHAYYRGLLQEMSGLVLTVRLAEVWYDESNGKVFWRGVPQSIYDPARHKCRVSTVQENRDNLKHIVRSLRELRPDLPIIVTLSPIPLKATFEAASIFTADCVSKSVLRVAIHELMAERDPRLYYWPSFEIVRWLGGHVAESFYGEDGNTRHINRRTVRLILESFIRHYYAAV
ncbi:MAG TPA: GSCFA domain-containing protein [Burkholderiales bacterium]|nr:GSCFA domain-containing protein [Burkholderiales bacterium]